MNVHFWTLAPGEPRSPTTELSAGVEPDRPIEWVVVAETMEFAAAEAIQAAILERNPEAHGAASVEPYPSYRLLYTLDGR